VHRVRRQTGSGKTFTITGGTERYQDRGLIPRALSHIFHCVKQRSDAQYTVYVSYMEIYNEQAYDLLDPSQESKALEDLPRIRLMEDDEGSVHLRNLSLHLATTEEDALNLLFLGDTNRAVSGAIQHDAHESRIQLALCSVVADR
jgi:kinesin family member 6/9